MQKQLRKEEGWSPDQADFALQFRIRFWPRKPAEEPHNDFQDILYRQISEDIAKGKDRYIIYHILYI